MTGAAPGEVYCFPSCCLLGDPCQHGANRPLGRYYAALDRIAACEKPGDWAGPDIVEVVNHALEERALQRPPSQSTH